MYLCVCVCVLRFVDSEGSDTHVTANVRFVSTIPVSPPGPRQGGAPAGVRLPAPRPGVGAAAVPAPRAAVRAGRPVRRRRDRADGRAAGGAGHREALRPVVPRCASARQSIPHALAMNYFPPIANRKLCISSNFPKQGAHFLLIFPLDIIFKLGVIFAFFLVLFCIFFAIFAFFFIFSAFLCIFFVPKSIVLRIFFSVFFVHSLAPPLYIHVAQFKGYRF